MLSRILFVVLLFPFFAMEAQDKETYVIGSKRFTENYILGEIFAQLLESKGHRVKRRFGMGGTMVAYKALEKGDIDIYPDYTGTIAKAVLNTDERDIDKLNKMLIPGGVKMLSPLGFENTYAIIVTEALSKKLNITKISDLAPYPDLTGAFSFEFQERSDGWPGLQRVYGLPNLVQGLDVPLTYEALKNGNVDFVEAYSTEPLIKKNRFVVLQDDKEFFPKYYALAIVKKDIPDKVVRTLETLNNKISNEQIIELNWQAVNKVPIPEIANRFLIDAGLMDVSFKKNYARGIDWDAMWRRTQTHLYLTMLAVLLATLVAVPLATWMASRQKLSQVILGFAGILQTIPSIALLTFMIPFFGIGFMPAIVGLFIYSLLPILRNTHIAMVTIDPKLITAARGIGLYPREVLFSVKLPLAFPTILAGIRTATILSIGTATLAAFIGAGGLGEPIVTGLALNDTSQVLQGAIPAAALAIVMDGFFSFINYFFVKEL